MSAKGRGELPGWAQPLAGAILRGVAALPEGLLRRLAGAPVERDGQRLETEVAFALRLLGEDASADYYELGVAEVRRRIDYEARLFGGRRLRVGAVRELTVPGPAGGLAARLYSPPGSGGTPPLVLYLHGGGWVVGSLDTHDQTCRFLARESGAAVVSLDYRLAPEHPFPAAPEDAAAGLGWALEHAAELGADPARVAIAGDSAGGNLAAVAAAEAAAAGRPPAMQALIYPVCDLSRKRRSYQLFREGYFLTERQMDWYQEQYLGDPSQTADPRISPLLRDDLAGAPPAYVAVAGFDPLRDEGLEYAERLRAAGAAVEVRLHRGLVHGFANAVGIGRASPAAMAELGAALRAGLAA